MANTSKEPETVDRVMEDASPTSTTQARSNGDANNNSTTPTDAPEPKEPEQPQKPTPGPRAQRFLDLHALALTNTLRTLSLPIFMGCFPLLSAAAPDVMAGMHSQLTTRLEAFAQCDFAEILRERRVVENLNELEELIKDALKRKKIAQEGLEGEERDNVMPEGAPGHLQGPETLLEAHLIGTLEGARGKLNAKEQTLLGENAKLFEEVKGQWAEIEALTKGVETLVGDLKGANGILGDER